MGRTLYDKDFLTTTASVFRALGAKRMNFVAQSSEDVTDVFVLHIMSEGQDGPLANPTPKVSTSLRGEGKVDGYLGTISVTAMVKYLRGQTKDLVPLPSFPTSPQDCPNETDWITFHTEGSEVVDLDMSRAINIASQFGFENKDPRMFKFAVLGHDGNFEVTGCDGCSFFTVTQKETSKRIGKPWSLPRLTFANRNVGKYRIRRLAEETHTYETVNGQHVSKKTEKVTAVRFAHDGVDFMYRCKNEEGGDFENIAEEFFARFEDQGLMVVGKTQGWWDKGNGLEPYHTSSCADWAKMLRKFGNRVVVRFELIPHPELREDDEFNQQPYLFSSCDPATKEGPMIVECPLVVHKRFPPMDENFRMSLGINPKRLLAGFMALRGAEVVHLFYRTDAQGQIGMVYENEGNNQEHRFGMMPMGFNVDGPELDTYRATEVLPK